MRKIDKLLAEYGQSHQNATNKAIHWICVPLIFFSIVGFLMSIPAAAIQRSLGDWVDWAVVSMILILIYYVSLSWTLAVGMALFSLLCLYVARTIGLMSAAPLWMVCLVIFVLAWIGQFYGHKVEGKKPSFFKDLQFLLVGPAWLMHFIFKKWGIRY